MLPFGRKHPPHPTMFNRFLLVLAILLPLGCISPITVNNEGPFGRQMARVLDRHDGYALELGADAALAESQLVWDLLDLPEVGASIMLDAADPVLERHDAWVLADESLDPDLDRPLFLLSSSGVRKMLDTAKR